MYKEFDFEKIRDRAEVAVLCAVFIFSTTSLMG